MKVDSLYTCCSTKALIYNTHFLEHISRDVVLMNAVLVMRLNFAVLVLALVVSVLVSAVFEIDQQFVSMYAS